MSEIAPYGVEITVQGIVQGVGFRPFVYRLAQKCNLVGSILNSDQGVVITIEGSSSLMQSFLDTLHKSPPPLARISSIEQTTYPQLKGFTLFSISSK